MKFVSFLLKGEAKFGISDGKNIIDLTDKILGARTLKELIEKKAISEAKKYASENDKNININEIEFLPLIPNPGKIICVGLNYSEHVKETGKTVEENPVVFLRVSKSQTAHNQYIQRPKVSTKLDFEGEMAVIMSEAGKHIKSNEAMKHIVGYSCYNESTVRDFQKHTSQFTMGKNFEKTGSFGPHMVLAEDIPDYTKLKIQTRLNGKVMQDANLNQLIFDIPTLISYISKALPWNAGDVLVTGTPGGVGFKRNPPVFMKDGDKVEVEISDIGVLSNIIKDEIS
jgi:2-keto-4-pentenoate hydratase/2-oxohepta-3-ene-1,7-dioic acid hydratase in catechol pathway|tara:strand:- start:197 stop:1048 length:852 start_codon:yes stop_codon:yes gene_type:complete